jgi:hypothetical protein
MKKATRSLGGHFKKEKQILKGFSRLLRRKKYIKKRQEAFSHFKKENQKLKDFCRLLQRRKHIRKRQKEWEVILKILRKNNKN